MIRNRLTQLNIKNTGGANAIRVKRRPLLPSGIRHFTPESSQAETSTSSASTPPTPREGWLFVDSVFPVRLGSWDLRHYIGIFHQEELLARLSAILKSVKTHEFEVVELEPHIKDGGVFVHFKYNAGEQREALETIEKSVREEAEKHGGIPSWTGLTNPGEVWLVKGTPWREDLHRYASPIVKFSYEGPDVHEELVYKLLRPYGRIEYLNPPGPVPAGTLRSVTAEYAHLRSATIARNVIHNFSFSPDGTSFSSSSGSGSSSGTRLRAAYVQPIQAHVFRDWVKDHPKTMLPVIVFLLGTLTYTIFDPIRKFMVEAKMLDWFDPREFKLYQWVRANTLDRLSINNHSGDDTIPVVGVWKERKEAESSLRSYLNDLPTTIAFVHGPGGSGKTRLLNAVLKETDRRALFIDCAELHKATSDTNLLSGLATQTGYWPVFTFLNSMNTMIDLASVGLIGQKAGLSSSITDQLKQVLEVVGAGLAGVSSSHRKSIQRKIKEQIHEEQKQAEEAVIRERIARGVYHDGRLDCIAGNGVMSELGFGDEMLTEDDMDWTPEEAAKAADLQIPENIEAKEAARKEAQEERERKRRSAQDAQDVAALPVVVIKNFAMKGGASREELLSVLATWCATLTENQIAHVVVISDNREHSKRLAKALPSRPLNSIALSDADADTALSFVTQKLKDAGIEQSFNAEETAYLERLGGRASDLDSLIRKVQSGQNVREAVLDIISRGVGELRKNAFGDDAEDAKSLPWSQEQAWRVLKQLSIKEEVPYHDLLIQFPFKGNETPLKSMEHAELISINTSNGRPSTIRPGKPVFKWVFEQLVRDPVFQANQDIAFNEKIIASSENTVRACEDELMTLKDLGGAYSSWWWWGQTPSSQRAKFLLSKMKDAEKKVEMLEKRNTELKKVLAKGEGPK
ncbi:hypothetical protein HWV62_13499 [Athelia sp. TMB]|nr:hypothetical protein HWV62_13499 [Athelia sp. TMB]